jgi:uridine kinase
VQPDLIAIDGLPCSGKGTLVAKLKQRVGLDCIELDDFVLPEEHWPSRDQPAFPFQFIRYNAFLDTVKTLAATGRRGYHPFDWNTLSTSEHPREVRFIKPIVIEGVSALWQKKLAPCSLPGTSAATENGLKDGTLIALNENPEAIEIAERRVQVWTFTC